jgi:multiple sugar transport system ATP-binding protein
MSRIVLKDIDKYYGENHVLKDLDLTIEDGDFMTLLGPSGCGKTTTLRVIAGLEQPQNGMIWIDDKLVVNAREAYFLPPSQRGLNLVFQSYALWPHMTVFNNVAFGMQIKHRPKAEIQEKVNSALQRMQIAQYADRYPGELSGGQQQRVAIARAIAETPKVLLLDEPLSNLDAKLRVDMRGELKRLHQDMGTTIVYVTHDQVEALSMSTRIAIFFDGRIEQVASPEQIYNNPSSVNVARFIGNPRINLMTGQAHWENGALAVDCPLGHYDFRDQHLLAQTGSPECQVAFRPEDIGYDPDSPVQAEVVTCQPAGSETTLELRIGADTFLAKMLGLHSYPVGSRMGLRVPGGRINVYDQSSGLLVKPID